MQSRRCLLEKSVCDEGWHQHVGNKCLAQSVIMSQGEVQQLSLFELIIFDCDGVLADSEMLSAQVLVEAFGDMNIEIDLEHVLQCYLGRSIDTIRADVAERMGFALTPDFFEDWTERLLTRYRAKLQPIPGVAELLDRLEVPVCVASSSAPKRLMPTLAYTGLDGYFTDRIFSATEVPRGKPAPDIFLHAAKRCGVEPAACLVIEDSLAGLRAARSAGMQCWLFTGGSHYRHTEALAGPDIEMLAKHADQAFDRMAIMAKAMQPMLRQL